MASAAEEGQQHQRIRVIGAGLGRTGSFTLQRALDILGYRALHFVDGPHAEKWAERAQGKATTDEIIDMIVGDGYDATMDNPCADIYAEQLERFPDAKVILTVRDTPGKFEASWKTLFDTMVVTEQPFSWTCPSFFQWIPLFRQLKTMRGIMGTHLGLAPYELTHGWRSKPDGWLAEQYNAHNSQVIAKVPKEQLLVFNVKEGWEPLCNFLGHAVPDVPFPNASKGVNDQESLVRMRHIFLGVVYGWIPFLGVTLLSALRCLRSLQQRRIANQKAKSS